MYFPLQKNKKMPIWRANLISSRLPHSLWPFYCFYTQKSTTLSQIGILDMSNCTICWHLPGTNESISPWKEQLARSSVRMRQKYNFQGKERVSLVGLWKTFGGEFPWKFLVLPYYDRGSRQRPVSIPDRSEQRLLCINCVGDNVSNIILRGLPHTRNIQGNKSYMFKLYIMVHWFTDKK